MDSQNNPNLLEDNIEIARYMSFTQFMSLLEFGRAYFPSVMQLRMANGNHGDPIEGTWGLMDMFLRNGNAANLDFALNHVFPASDGTAIEEKVAPPTEFLAETPFGKQAHGNDRSLHQLNNSQCQWMDAWCWHRHTQEHMSMWRQYGLGDGSVLVKSTVGKLRKSLDLPNGTKLHIDDVCYTDRGKAIDNVRGEFTLFLQKSIAYRYEDEIRALVYDPLTDLMQRRPLNGRNIQVDLKLLITDVVAHPDTPPWIFALVDRLSHNYLGKGVLESTIAQERKDTPTN